MNAFAAVLILALAACPGDPPVFVIDGTADPAPRIAGATSYLPYALVRLQAENVGPKAALLWRVSPSAGVDRATTSRGVLEFSAPPGTYAVELLVISGNPDGSLALVELRTSVTIASAGPPAGPPTSPATTKAIGRLRFGNAGCTATVIGPRRADGRWDVLTASHCTGEVGTHGSLTMKDGRVLAVRVVARDTRPDLSWLVTEDATLADLPYATLAEQDPAPGTPVWQAGYGENLPGVVKTGVVTGPPLADGSLPFMLSVSSGDSGGPIFRADTGEVVAAVCCTAAKGQYAKMYGGSAVSARALRRSATARDELPEAYPVPQLRQRSGPVIIGSSQD